MFNTDQKIEPDKTAMGPVHDPDGDGLPILAWPDLATDMAPHDTSDFKNNVVVIGVGDWNDVRFGWGGKRSEKW